MDRRTTIEDEPQTKRPRISATPPLEPAQAQSKDSTDLYLDTINRHMLDFDFEKVCSVSLSQINVYACLTCGKYYQGRGKSSHAYFHSMDKDHHVFINLSTLKVKKKKTFKNSTKKSTNNRFMFFLTAMK